MPKKPFTVLTFNILGAWDRRDAAIWDQRVDRVAAAIREARAELVGLQEVTQSQVQALDAKLPDLRRAPLRDPIGATTEAAVEDEPLNVILYRPDRFRFEKGGLFWLGIDPTRPSRDWDAAFPRCAAWARLLDRATDEPILFVSTHLDNFSECARAEGAALVLNFLRQTEDAAIVVGDFNSDASLAIHKRLIQGPPRMQDAWEETRDEPGAPYSDGTFHDFTGKPLPQVGRIDWILFAGPLTATEARILDPGTEGSYPSDHFPVLAKFTSD
jgi:endonuclease/exonuclease/phosphatase family metal-dependent hydrolase